MGENIELHPEQTEHYDRLSTILSKYDSGADMSRQGLGKTIISLKRAHDDDYELIVICTCTLVSQWIKQADKYGVQIKDIMSYTLLRGQKKYSLSHSLLTRQDNEYTSHPEFEQTCLTNFKTRGKRIMLIFDEFQNAKNDNITSKSCITLAHTIYSTNKQLPFEQHNKVMLLSGTASQSISSAGIFSQLLGWAPEGNLYIKNENVNVLDSVVGFNILIDNCKQLNLGKTNDIVPKYISGDIISSVIHRLLIEVIFPHIRSKVPEFDFGVSCAVRDLFMLLSNENDIVQHREGLQCLANMRMYGCSKDNKHRRNALLNKGMMLIEYSKLSSILRWVTRDLLSDGKTKVIVGVWHSESVEYLQKQLNQWSPLVLHGKTSKNSDVILDKFRHDSQHRLFIGHPMVFGQGLDFHDIYGDMPRKMYISSSYRTLLIEQTISRIYRIGAKSDSQVYIVYGNSESGKGEYNLVEKSLKNRGHISSYDGRTVEARQILYEQVDGSLTEEDGPDMNTISGGASSNNLSCSSYNNKISSVSMPVFQQIQIPQTLIVSNVKRATLIRLN